MFWKSLLTSVFLFFSASVLAQQTFEHGVLQAYWLPMWNDNGTQNTPRLKYRYFVLNHNSDVEKVINIDISNEKRFLLHAKDFFRDVPKNFTDFREGHLEQAGSLTVEKLTLAKECDHYYSAAKLIKFNSVNQPLYDIDKIEKSAGCEAYPYIITYAIKPDIKNLYFRQSPSVTAKNTSPIPDGVPLVKMRTINKNWIQAAVYDESKAGLIGTSEGYIELKNLQPIN